jgi:hypothetical protein
MARRSGQQPSCSINLRGVDGALYFGRAVGLSDNLGHDPRGALIGDSFFQSLPLVYQVAVIHAQQMQQRGMKIMNADAILHSLVADFVRCAMDLTLFYAGTRHPHGEARGGHCQVGQKFADQLR